MVSHTASHFAWFVRTVFLLANLCNVRASFEYSSEVVVLDADKFKSTVNQNQSVLVKFFAPWCGHCKSFAPRYSELAAKLKEAGYPITVAALDATLYTDIAEEQDIQQYPTLRFFHFSRVHDYNGLPNPDDILKWIDLKYNPAIRSVGSIEELENLKGANKVVFVSSIKDNSSDNYLTLDSLADFYEGDPFFVSITDADILQKLNSGFDRLMVFKQFDEPTAALEGSLTPENIKRFVGFHRIPLLTDFNPDDAKKIFDVKTNVLLFAGKQDANEETTKATDRYREEMRKAAKNFRGVVAFAHIDSNKEEHRRIMEYFDLSEDSIPAVRLVKLGEELTKYNFDDQEINADKLTAFVQSFLDGKLKPHYRSQPLPEDWNKGPVTVVVQSNFDEVVKDPSKTVLIEFYAPWCGICQRLEPVYEKLGEHFKNRDDVVIAKMDATINEIENVPIRSFPTIHLYPKRDGAVVNYDGDRTLESLVAFVNSEGATSKPETPAGPAPPRPEEAERPAKEEL